MEEEPLLAQVNANLGLISMGIAFLIAISRCIKKLWNMDRDVAQFKKDMKIMQTDVNSIQKDIAEIRQLTIHPEKAVEATLNVALDNLSRQEQRSREQEERSRGQEERSQQQHEEFMRVISQFNQQPSHA